MELNSIRGEKAEFRCPACGCVLEALDGSKFVAFRLTVQPSIRALSD
jgi:transcription initiation factor IIE alpha subunit